MQTGSRLVAARGCRCEAKVVTARGQGVSKEDDLKNGPALVVMFEQLVCCILKKDETYGIQMYNKKKH